MFPKSLILFYLVRHKSDILVLLNLFSVQDIHTHIFWGEGGWGNWNTLLILLVIVKGSCSKEIQSDLQIGCWGLLKGIKTFINAMQPSWSQNFSLGQLHTCIRSRTSEVPVLFSWICTLFDSIVVKILYFFGNWTSQSPRRLLFLVS